jgi:branched-chain amino acid transport system permease protein
VARYMDFTSFSQTSVNWIMLGGIYSIIALGITLIFSIMRIIQFAHGQVYMLGAFAVYFLAQEAGLNYFLSIALAMGIIGMLALLMERAFFRPLRGQAEATLLMTFALSLLLEGSALLGFGPNWKRLDGPISGSLELFGVFLQKERLVAALQGVNVNRIYTVGFVIGSGLAAFAAGLIAPLGFIAPPMGTPMLIKSFIVIIVGGLGNVAGAVVGAFVLAFIDSFGTFFFGSSMVLLGFVLVVLILMVKPAGLVGRG